MARFVLTKQRTAPGEVAAPETMWTPQQIRRLPKVRVLDQTGDRIMLIEIDPKDLDGYRFTTHGWKVTQEVVYAAPWEMDPPF
jgi:hypothetical protein